MLPKNKRAIMASRPVVDVGPSLPPPPHPPFDPHSDTPYASSDLYTPTNHSNEPLHSQPRPPRHDSLSKAPRSRAFSTASSTSSVRRKPLPPDASPLAIRFSSGERLARTVELPERAFARPFSIDSPTVYDDYLGANSYHSLPSPTLELPEPDSDSDSVR